MHRVTRIAFLLAIGAVPFGCIGRPTYVQSNPAVKNEQRSSGDFLDQIEDNSRKMLKEGREIFRHDTFGSEDFWSGKLRLDQAVAGERFGGVGHGLEPKDALKLGLKVDTGVLPKILVQAVKGGSVDLGDVKTTMELLKADAVVGIHGKYDAELNQDGKAFRPDGKSAATVIPAAFGLAGVNLHTYTGWGSVTYWNAYVATTQMQGNGTFFDPRISAANGFPIGAKASFDNVRRTPDRVTPKLAALHYYQLSIPAPTPKKDSYDNAAAARGEALFNGKATCARCHVPPLYTEPGWGMHRPEEVGVDDFQASRSPDKMYRTTPLKALLLRATPGF